MAENGFNDIMTACSFAWEEMPDGSRKFMCSEMQRYCDKYFKKPSGRTPGAKERA